MAIIGIVGNGPSSLIPDLHRYKEEVDFWIGADRGALTILAHELQVDIAMGDFDSTSETETKKIKQAAQKFICFPAEKDETDIELTIEEALKLKPEIIYLFGVTGGRMDHELINIQILHTLVQSGWRAKIMDQQNEVELILPGKHTIIKNELFPYISFIPFTKKVEGITLENFYYPLINRQIRWGSTLSISNELLGNSGTISFSEGILLVIKSRDASSHPIQK